MATGDRVSCFDDEGLLIVRDESIWENPFGRQAFVESPMYLVVPSPCLMVTGTPVIDSTADLKGILALLASRSNG